MCHKGDNFANFEKHIEAYKFGGEMTTDINEENRNTDISEENRSTHKIHKEHNNGHKQITSSEKEQTEASTYTGSSKGISSKKLYEGEDEGEKISKTKYGDSNVQIPSILRNEIEYDIRNLRNTEAP